MISSPLGKLSALSAATRRALWLCTLLAGINYIALIAQAWGLAYGLARIVAGEVVIDIPLLVLASAIAVRTVCTWAMDTVAMRAAAGTQEELRAALLAHTLQLGPEWLADHKKSGGGPTAIATLANQGLAQLDNYFTRYLPALVTVAIAPPLVGLAIFIADWLPALVLLATLPLLPLFAIVIGKHTVENTATATNTMLRLASQSAELIKALPILISFGRAKQQEEVVQRVSYAHRMAARSALRVAFTSALALELLATLSVALIAVLIGVRLAHGDFDLSIGLFVLILAPECYQAVRALGVAHHASEDGAEVVGKVVEILKEPIPVSGYALPTKGKLVITELTVLRRGKPAPDSVTLSIQPGEFVRLDTPSGSGKSTLLAVLLGFCPAEKGNVTLNGTELTMLNMQQWRRHIAWVPQRPAFSASTVRGELELAITDLTDGVIFQEKLVGVTKKVGLQALLDRSINELSAGERQRLAVARALLRHQYGAWLLLLDEPTAHLDIVTARQVMAAIRETLHTGAAIILATHATTAESEVTVLPAKVNSIKQIKDNTIRKKIWTLYSPKMIAGSLLGAGALASGIALTAISAWLIAKAAQQPPILTLLVAVVGVRFFGLGRAILRYLERLVTHDAAFQIVENLRIRTWRVLTDRGPVRLGAIGHAAALQRLVLDTDTIRDTAPRVLAPPMVVVAVSLAAVTVSAVILPVAGLILGCAVLCALVLAILSAWVTGKKATVALTQKRAELATHIATLTNAAPDLLATGLAKKYLDDINVLGAHVAKYLCRQAKSSGLAQAIIVLIVGSAAVTNMGLAATAVAAGELNPLLAPVLALLPLTLTEAFNLIPAAVQQYRPLALAHDNLTTLHNPSGLGINAIKSAICTGNSPDAIKLSGVSVRWPGMTEPVLQDVHLQVPRGSHLAVIGPSGAGKSTLFALILGFLPAEDGMAQLPEQITWCPQDPQLVSTTIRENLRLGDPTATDEQLSAALRAVALAEWVDRLDVVIGVSGATISGGEAQRLALARSLLHAKHTQVLLLDEPTAHLDVATAERVITQLKAQLPAATIVQITHRPAEAALADDIVRVGAA